MSVIVAQRPVSMGSIVGVVGVVGAAVVGAAIFAAVPQAQAGMLAGAAVVVAAFAWATSVRARSHLQRGVAGMPTRRARRHAARHARIGLRWHVATRSLLIASVVLGTAASLRVVLSLAGVA